jgi:hypothetical protein
MLPNESASAEQSPRAVGPIVATVFGYILLLITGFFYLVSGLVVPFPYLFFMWGLWIAIVGVAILKRADWRVVAAAPFVSIGLWFAIVWAGGRFLGWTA